MRLRRNKYNAQPTTIDGVRFHSKREAQRYLELKFLEAQGLIRNLELQPKFPIEINQMKICTYKADFKYIDNQTHSVVIEDSKGYRTKEYKLKCKLVKAVHGLEVVEV